MTARGRMAFGLTLGSFVWGLALVVGAFAVPVYSGSTATSSGASWSSQATLVEVNGLWVLAPVVVPVALAAIAWIALHRKCAHGGDVGGYVAWSCVALLGAFSVLASASIGLFVLPAAILLAAAARLTPDG